MEENTPVPVAKGTYLSERKSGARLNFYAVTNSWDRVGKKQSKTQIFLGSLSGGKYRFNERAWDYFFLFVQTPHELAYLRWRENKLLQENDFPPDASIRSVKRAGISLILNHAAREMPLWDMLEHVFGEKNARGLLSLAYFALMMSPFPLAKICVWSESRELPSESPVTIEEIRRLFREVSSKAIGQFLSLWLAMSPRENRLPFAMMPKARIGKGVSDVMHGIRRDSFRLPEIRILLIMDDKTLLPLWFGMLPWVETEKASVAQTLAAISRLDGTPQRLVFDRSFAMEENFRQFFNRGVKFTVDVPFWKFPKLRETLDKAKRLLADESEWTSLPPFLRYDVWIKLRAFSHFESFSKHRAHIHLYHVAYSDECKDRLIQEIRRRIRQAKKSGLPPDDEDLLLADLFRQGSRTFESSTCQNQVTPGSLLDEDNGYFAILSSQFKDPAEAMIACELRYTTENFFSDLQNDEDCYRLDVYTPHNLYVRVFIQFIAQILRSYLRRVINQNHEKLPWGQPAHAVLWEIDSLQQVETVDGRRFYRDATPMQEQILDMFGIDIRKSR